ncbi:MAG: TlpA family protein disulfide reductase [Actinomycetota bacterium]
MPVVDGLAAEYGGRVDFVAPAWKSSFEATEARANELFQSGQIMWGLDEDEEIFNLYDIPYQPVTVLIAADQTVVEAWDGLRPEEEIRAAIEDLMALSG